MDAAAAINGRLRFLSDALLFATTVIIAVFTTLSVLPTELLRWCLVWVVLVAFALLPPRRAAAQAAVVLVVSAVSAIPVPSNAGTG